MKREMQISELDQVSGGGTFSYRGITLGADVGGPFVMTLPNGTSITIRDNGAITTTSSTTTNPKPA
jgi:hypothetical protein